MGRRSTKTTKTGKYMNPTDQWRKQCRKRELKKNKQQRTAVREAVIKSKNPQQLLAEIEEIEKMEIEAGGEELPNDKGLKEKKRKLHETLQRIINFYEREDYNKAQQVKTLIVESEKRRRDMTTVYSSYRTARSQYDVSDIPLPEGPSLEEDEGVEIDPSDIPLPEGPSTKVHPGLIPPGPPPGPPPEIVYPKAVTARPKRAVHFDEDENVDDDISSAGSSDDSEGEDDDEDQEEDASEESGDDKHSKFQPQDHILPEPPRPPGPPPGLPPPGIRYPPPLFPPPHPPITTVPIVPQIPPRPLLPPTNKPSPHFQSSAVISASAKTDNKQSAVISAQPQIRNVQAEVTKFLPTSLRVRRENPKQVKPNVRSVETAPKVSSSTTQRSGVTSSSGGMMRGDAYEAFMKEMQGLI